MAQRLRLKRIKRVKKRSGSIFKYYRRRDGALVPLPRTDETHPDFLAAYAAAARDDHAAPALKIRPSRSLGALAMRYLASAEFADLAPTTKESRRRLVRSILEREKHGLRMEDMSVAAIAASTIERHLSEHRPQAARNRLKV